MDVKTKIISQFIKDLSFENPKGPFPFAKKDDRPSLSAVSYTHLTLPTILRV